MSYLEKHKQALSYFEVPKPEPVFTCNKDPNDKRSVVEIINDHMNKEMRKAFSRFGIER